MDPRSFQKAKVGRTKEIAVICATKQTDIPTVVELLVDGVNVNTRELATGKSLLHLAVESGSSSLVNCILGFGSCTRIADNRGETPMMSAIRLNRMDLVQMIRNEEMNCALKPPSTCRKFYFLLNDEYTIDISSLKGVKELVVKDECQQSGEDSERCSVTFEGVSAFAPISSEASLPPPLVSLSNPWPFSSLQTESVASDRRGREFIAMEKFKDVEYSPMICNATSQASSRGATPRSKRMRPLSPAPLAIRSLCDYLTSPHISMPVTVGFFERAGVMDNHTNKLYGELKTFSPSAAKIRLKLTWLLVLTPVFLALICGYVVYLFSHFHAGIGVTLAFLLVQATLLIAILVGSRSRHWGWAIIFSRCLSKFIGRFNLLLKMVFMYPRVKRDEGSEVRFLLVRRSIVTGNVNQYILDVLEEVLWRIESLYGTVNSRIFRVYQPSEETGRCFKSICFIPKFILFIIYLLAFAIALMMIRLFARNMKLMWSDHAITTCFIFMLCIAGLGTIILFSPIYRSIRNLCRSPRNKIKQLSDLMDLETLAVSIKNELAKAGTLLDYCDRYYGNVCTRIVIVLDGADTYNQERIIRCLEMLYNIFSNFHRSPFIVIISTDIQVLLSDCDGDVNQAVENLSLLNAVVNLQVHMQHLSTLHFSTPQTPVYNGTFCIRYSRRSLADHSGRSIDSASAGTPNSPSRRRGLGRRREDWPHLNAGGVSFESLSMVSLCRFHDRALESARTLTEQLLAKGQMSEMNLKILPHLLATVFYTGRHLRLRQVDFKLSKLIAWVTLACHWPFRTAWIAWYLQDYWDRLDSRVTLPQIDERIDSKLSLLGANLKIFFNLDRDQAKLTVYMNSMGHVLTVGDLKKFYPSSLFLMYQLRQFIRNYFANKPLLTPRLTRKPFEFQSSTLDFNTGISHSSFQKTSSKTSFVDYRDDDGDAVSVISNPSALTKCTPLAENMPPLTKTPSSSRRCLVKLKDGYPDAPLSTMTVDDVCELLVDIDGIAFRHVKDYQNRLREMNITGLVLNVCDLNRLRPELNMTFGDWQLFETLVLRLRDLDATNTTDEAELAALSMAAGVDYRSPFDLEDVPRPLERTNTLERSKSAPDESTRDDGVLDGNVCRDSSATMTGLDTGGDSDNHENLPTPLHHLQMLCKQILKEAHQEKASKHYADHRKTNTVPSGHVSGSSGSSRRRKSRTFSLPQLGQRFSRRKQADYLEEASRVYGFTKGARAYEMQRCYVVAAPHQRAYEEGEEELGEQGQCGDSETEDDEGESAADLPPPPLLSSSSTGVGQAGVLSGLGGSNLVGPLPPLLGGECTCEFWFNLERQRRFLSQQHPGPFLHHHQACAAGRAVPVHMETVHPDVHHNVPPPPPPPPPPVPPDDTGKKMAGSTI